MMEQGQINVQTENIFPIIKKFLYSDHEIFLRELVSNAVDATQKLKRLARMGEFSEKLGDLRIQISNDEKAHKLIVSDSGIGMTEDEVKKYINQIAFSSAQEFLDKFEKAGDPASIIGHFGLGFYSAFMVAEKVEIVTKSYKKDAPAVKWSCDGTPNYEMEETEKEEHGTDIILYLNEDSHEFSKEWKINELLNKYCKFLPIEIQFGTKEETITKGEGKDAKEEKVVKDNIINNTEPAWTKSPSELKDEDYQAFYSELYPYAQPPLFWIHLNVDFPFNLTGILYFPKVGQTYEVQKNKIQLYSNQVFVTDSVENIVPEFLMHLHGVIDSPDIPLNVSRSYLQSDPNVKKINSHISKKVADKLDEIFKNERESFEEKWEEMSVFVKYGMISDDKFYDKAKDFFLLKNTEGGLKTYEEYKEKVKANQTDKDDKLVLLYSSNTEAQDQYIQGAKSKGYDVLLFDTVIDNHFMQQLEQKMEKLTFKRVDADTLDKLIEKDTEQESVLSKDEEEKLEKLFKDNVSEQNITVQLKALSHEDEPVYITKPEFMRRMMEMQELSGQKMPGMSEFANLVVNTNHPVASKILKAKKEDNKKALIGQLYDLALLSQGMLKGKKLTDFVHRSVGLLK
ncbi:MAG: molecular chaperone HtpG [Chitinophagales bacterium]